MSVKKLLEQLDQSPEAVEFEQVMEIIQQHYSYSPSRFTNSDVTNEKSTNEGSCKIFAFGLLNDLSENKTLNCFGKYYRQDVRNNPQGNDHANIRAFIKNGWKGIAFDQTVLTLKSDNP